MIYLRTAKGEDKVLYKVSRIETIFIQILLSLFFLVTSTEVYAALYCIDLVKRTEKTTDIISRNQLEIEINDSSENQLKSFLYLKSLLQIDTIDTGASRYVLQSYEISGEQKARVDHILDLKADAQGYYALHGMKTYSDGKVSFYTLYIPKTKLPYEAITLDSKGDYIVRTHLDTSTGKESELRQKIKVYIDPVTKKNYKRVESAFKNDEFSIMTAIDPGMDGFSIFLSYNADNKRHSIRFPLKNLNENIKGKITQVLIDNYGTRVSFITTKDEMYSYEIKIDVLDDGKLSVTLVNPKLTYMPTDQINKILYINPMVNLGN